MTRAFDQAAREAAKSGFWPLAKHADTNHAVKSITVRLVPVSAARPYVASFHYSRTMPDATMEVFRGDFPDGSLAGFVVFGVGVSRGQYTRLLPDLQDGEYRELTRLWSPDGLPRNTESRLIAASVRRLPTSVRLIVSYADPSRGHLGTIYQAASWVYLGMTTPGARLVDASGQEVHQKLMSVYRMRHPAKYGTATNAEIAEAEGLTFIDNPAKHRYAIARRREDREMLAEAAQPYPRAVAASSDASGTQPGEGGPQPTRLLQLSTARP